MNRIPKDKSLMKIISCKGDNKMAPSMTLTACRPLPTGQWVECLEMWDFVLCCWTVDDERERVRRYETTHDGFSRLKW